MPRQADVRRAAGLPVLPREVLYEVVQYLVVPATDGESESVRALVRLSAVSCVCRAWALDAQYQVLVLPRHVREFRQWYARMRSTVPPFPTVGHVRALFIGMDDVSAGWEAEMLRVLHYHGSTIEHLSLWQTESRALLRDAAQVSGRHTQAAWAVGEHLFDDAGADEGANVGADAPARADDMPHWLSAELQRASMEDVARNHVAHFPLVPRARPQAAVWQRRPPPRLCTPRCLSLVMHYPFYENERPELFSKMRVWTCVEELDVYVPMELPKSLALLATLTHTPTRRLRLSTAHTTLAIASDVGGLNACAVLAGVLASPELNEALLLEFRGRGVSAPRVLENACLRHLALGADAPVQVCLTRGHQDVWGKLRHRLWDFRERALFRQPGAWAQVLRTT